MHTEEKGPRPAALLTQRAGQEPEDAANSLTPKWQPSL